MTTEQLVKGGVTGVGDRYRVLTVEGPWACVRERLPLGDGEDPMAPTHWVAAERVRGILIAEAHAVDCDVNAEDARLTKDTNAATAWMDMASSARDIRDEIVGER